jgi:pimeloyl-ACP methyl ester carboxylesterase
MPRLQLSSGPIDYEDRGKGPVVVLLHGLFMDSSHWRHVVADLEADYRCVAPTLPIGAHREPMNGDADLTLSGQVHLLEEFLERLELRDITLVGVDTGAGLSQLLIQRRPELVARVALLSAEAFDNYPPGLPGHIAWLAAQVPGGINLAMQSLRLRPLRRLPITFGWMAKRPVPVEIMDAWLRPSQTQREIRRDVRKYTRGARRDKGLIAEATVRMARFQRPALVVWATEDRVFPIEQGRRLADLIPNARLVEVPDSYALIPEDQPHLLNSHLRQFLAQ